MIENLIRNPVVLNFGKKTNSFLRKRGFELAKIDRYEQDTECDNYESLFGADAVKGRCFYNIGSGRWEHPYWTSVDYFACHRDNSISWNACKKEPLPIKSDSAEALYTSHMVEHLTNNEAEFLFREAFRVLKSKRFFRIVVPDTYLAYKAYLNNDLKFFKFQHNPSIEWSFVSLFAQRLIRGDDRSAKPLIFPEQIRKLYEEFGFEGACDHLVSMIDLTAERIDWYNHCSWWSFEKMQRKLKEAGFSTVLKSGYGQSENSILRDTRYFDRTFPYLSLYVDAIK